MRHAAFVLTLCVVAISRVHGLGCIPALCEDTENTIRACPDSDGTCGTYGGKRHDDSLVNAVDLVCEPNLRVFAPFDGQVLYWRPHGGVASLRCIDKGIRIEGTGQWQGYYATIAYVDLTAYGRVVKGQEIGRSLLQTCSGDSFFKSPAGFDNHIQFSLYRNGQVVDPTYHLKDCMCTGQICESNPTNELKGQPFTTDSRYNGVKGWELVCPQMYDQYDANGNMINPEDIRPRTPNVRAPIDGKYIGRVRLTPGTGDNKGAYKGCANDGLVIVGTGKWEHYTARMYNVRLLPHMTTGKRRVHVGQNVATRLECKDESVPDTVFVEVRYRGVFVDMSSAISAANCSLTPPPGS